MRPRSAASPLVVCLALLGGCRDALGPDGARQPSDVRLASGLRLAVTVAPADVRAGDSVTVHVRVRNPTDAPVQVTSGCSSLAMLGFRRTDGRESLLAAGFGCYAVVRQFTLAPDETVTYEHRFAARTFEGTPVAPGRYVAQAFSQLPGDTRTDVRNEQRPNAEAEFVVR